MNRRESLKALAIQSMGATSPLLLRESLSENRLPATEIHGDKEGDTTAAESTYATSTAYYAAQYGDFQLVTDSAFLDALARFLPSSIKSVSLDIMNPGELVKDLASGGAMVWVGPVSGVPAALSVGAFKISNSEVVIKSSDSSPVATSEFSFSNSTAYSAYISPPKEMPNHNVDEEVRADFIPILEAHDRFGNLVGYPGILMSYFAPSLAAGRFKGSECFFFLFDNPLEILDAENWKKIFDKISDRRKSGLQVNIFETNYAAYILDERVQIRTRLQNRRPKAVSASIRYKIKIPGSPIFKPLMETRRVAGGFSDTESICDFRPEPVPGLWTVRVEILQDVEDAEQLALIGNPRIIDQRDLGFMVIDRSLNTPSILECKGPAIVLDKKEGFVAGTHYYPSTSWWEWAWKEFYPLKVSQDFAAIRRAGYKIVRVWIDPVIDEKVLRAMDVAIKLASENGIVLDICIFTQWVRQMGFERPSGEHVLFEYRNIKDFNIVSFSLRNMDLQREFVEIIASRWKAAGNVLYNLANEVYLKDPDESQMDKEAVNWKGIPRQNGTIRDSLLFRRWANEMTKAIRSTGAMQPVMAGYMFSTLNGGDVYLANADSPILPWHSYLPPQQTALTLQYFDSGFSDRPVLLEEFGTLGWNPVKHYDANVHYALGAGAAGAMSYEWGVSWLSRESCYWPLPLREATYEEPDPRWFPPYLNLGETWSERGVGLCPTPSGTGYGSIYHGTPFPADAAVALGRLSLMGEGLQRINRPEKVYVIIPAANLEALETLKTTLSSLYSKKTLFGICQESNLHSLPLSVKALIIPWPLSEKSASKVEALRSNGIKIYSGHEGWKLCNEFERAFVSHGSKVDLLARRTAAGTLFTLISKQHEGPVSLTYGDSGAKLGLIDFGLVHITQNGVILLEGEGTLSINKSPFCEVSAGRLIVASEDAENLLRSKQLKLMITKPSLVSFEHKIASVAIGDGFNKKSEPIKVNSGSELNIDDQMLRYVIHVSLK